MAEYRVEFNTKVSLTLIVNEEDEDLAADVAWEVAEGYLQTLGTQTGDARIVAVEASLDGVGADSVEER